MEKIWHFSCYSSDLLIEKLQDLHISFELATTISGKSSLLRFDVSEKHPDYEQLRSMCGEDVTDTYKITCTPEDMASAQWFAFQPLTTKIELDRYKETFTLAETFDNGRKAHHKYRTGKSVYVRRTPKYSKQQHFFGCIDSPSYVFCSAVAKKCLSSLEENLEFAPILHTKTGEPVEDLYEMKIHDVLPLEMIDLSNSESTYSCPVCGKQTHMPPVPLRVYGETLNNDVMFYKTVPEFSFGGNVAFEINIMSQAAYRELKRFHLLRGLELIPVELI